LNCSEQGSTEPDPRDDMNGIDVIEARRRAAAAEGRILRYVDIIENGRASMALRAVDKSRVMQGPGAGAQATAGGVFADIVRIARTLV